MEGPAGVGVGEVHLAPEEGAVHAPAGGEEVFEVGGIRDALADAYGDPAVRGTACGHATAPTGVRDGVAVVMDGHPRPDVRQPEGGPGDGHRDQAGGVEGAEDHAAAPVGVHGVEADVGLGEGAEVGDAGEAEPADAVHAEGDEPDVGDAVEGVGDGAGRQQGGDVRRVGGPVQEGEVQPGLGEQWAGCRAGRVGRDGFQGSKGHSASMAETERVQQGVPDRPRR